MSYSSISAKASRRNTLLNGVDRLDMGRQPFSDVRSLWATVLRRGKSLRNGFQERRLLERKYEEFWQQQQQLYPISSSP